MYVSESHARDVLAGYLPRLAQAIALADVQVRSDNHLSPLMRLQLGPSAMANVRHCVVVEHTRRLINHDTDPDVWWDKSSGIELLYVRDLAICRFKRLDKNLLSRNIPTGQAVRFEDPQVPMLGMPATAARFTIGWQTDEFERAVQARWIVQPNRRQAPLWAISLDEVAAGAMPVSIFPVTLPVRPQQDRVQPKKQAGEGAEHEGKRPGAAD